MLIMPQTQEKVEVGTPSGPWGLRKGLAVNSLGVILPLTYPQKGTQEKLFPVTKGLGKGGLTEQGTFLPIVTFLQVSFLQFQQGWVGSWSSIPASTSS